MNDATQTTMLDVTSSPVIVWGDTREDVLYVDDILQGVIATGERAKVAGEYASEHAAFVAELRGAATGLGLVLPADADVVASLRSFLLASRDHEGQVSEDMINAAKGADEGTQRAARVAAMAFSGRRGVLDSAAYMIDRGLAHLIEIKAHEAKLAARQTR